MENTSNNTSATSGIFSPLHSEEPGITLAELQQYVAAPSAPAAFGFRFLLSVLAGMVVIGSGLFYALQNDRSPNMHSESMKIQSVQQTALLQNTTDAAQFPIAKEIISQTTDRPSAKLSHSSFTKTSDVSETILNSLKADHSSLPSNRDVNIITDSSNTNSQASSVKAISNSINNSDRSLNNKEVHRSINSIKDSSAEITKAFRTLTDDQLQTIRNSGESRYRMFGALQAGVIISSLNTSGGGVAINFEHDWQHVGFRYSSTFGTKDNSSELFRKLNPVPNGATAAYPNYQYTQNVIEYTIQFGATIKEGDFWATFSAGPNYTNSSALTSYVDIINKPPTPQLFIPQYGTVYTGYSWKGLGASAQASFGYKFNRYIGAEFTGFASDHSQIAYGGILFSVVLGILQ